MDVKALFAGIDGVVVYGDTSRAVVDLTDDSRRVVDGGCFVARRGTGEDGGRYIEQAIDRGAGVIVSELQRPGSMASVGDDGVVWVQLPGIDQRLCGELGERFFGRPSEKMPVVGVTGTNGKTTVGFLVRHLLGVGGVKCGLIGTVCNDVGASDVETSGLTTPGGIEFSRLLSRMVDTGCGAAVAEVSSHALEQGRVDAVRFGCGVFTNITGDHLDYHGSIDRYARAKARLFEGLGFGVPAILNAADERARLMVSRSRAKVRWSLVEGDGDGRVRVGEAVYRARVLSLGSGHSDVRMVGPWGTFDVRLGLVGRFNVSNALQATGVAWELGVKAEAIREALTTAPGVPGRVEVVRVDGAAAELSDAGEIPEDSGDSGLPGIPGVVVDYAHTHDALENVLGALRPLTRGRLMVVFGCGGDRDRSKRAKMGEVASRLADVVVVTSDNPRTEEPGDIIKEVLSGVRGGIGGSEGAEVLVEADRGAAIELAIGQAGVGDTVLLAGKGHEDYQIVGDLRLAFDDRVFAGEVLQRRQQDADISVH